MGLGLGLGLVRLGNPFSSPNSDPSPNLMPRLVRADGLQQPQAAHRLPIVLREVVERRLLLEQRLQPRLHSG